MKVGLFGGTADQLGYALQSLNSENLFTMSQADLADMVTALLPHSTRLTSYLGSAAAKEYRKIAVNVLIKLAVVLDPFNQDVAELAADCAVQAITGGTNDKRLSENDIRSMLGSIKAGRLATPQQLSSYNKLCEVLLMKGALSSLEGLKASGNDLAPSSVAKMPAASSG
ncbi:MAG: hypothetical protein P1U40_14200 [Coxiellaceae bacterium]|nr:hypothetical protein [Coxiellaceae bacterium]